MIAGGRAFLGIGFWTLLTTANNANLATTAAVDYDDSIIYIYIVYRYTYIPFSIL